MVNVDEVRVLEEAQLAGERTYLKFQDSFKEHIERYNIRKLYTLTPFFSKFIYL